MENEKNKKQHSVNEINKEVAVQEEKTKDDFPGDTKVSVNKKTLIKLQKRQIIAIVAVFAIILALIVCGKVLSSNLSVAECQKAIDTWIIISNGKADEKTFKSFVPEEVWKYFEEEKNISFDFCYNLYVENYVESEEYDYTYTVLNNNELNENGLKELSRGLNIYFGLPENICTEAYEFTIEITEESLFSHPLEMYIVVFKIGDDWYCFNEIFAFFDYCCSQYEESSSVEGIITEKGSLMDSYPTKQSLLIR